MKKFILSLSIMFTGVLIFCSTIIAEGLKVGGYNSRINGFATDLFSLNDNAASIILLIIGAFMFVVGLVLSIVTIKEKKN